MEIACLDLEGVLIPEVWIKLAEKTGIQELYTTTREVPDYDELMTMRLGVLKKNGLGLPEIQAVVATMSPLPGAPEFLDWLRDRFQVIILSDTYYEFTLPLMKQLGYPTLFCHRLNVNADGSIQDYLLRQPDPKRASVKALHSLNFRIIATGDSYNDISMLSEADAGILFSAPDTVRAEYPHFPAVDNYDALRAAFLEASQRDLPS